MKELSIILEDWGVRERFHTLDWLSQQTISRDQYEIIWVELRDRVLEHVKAKVDHLLTLNQDGLYHKHKGMNVGVAKAQGRVVTLCDSDAVYPPNFVESVLAQFEIDRKVLMHYQSRTFREYPDGVTSFDEIVSTKFWDRWPNVGACMSVLRRDFIGFGGVDEHEVYCGLICGHNELVWRMVNSGMPEVWDESVFTYHFRHPGSDGEPSTQNQWQPGTQHIEMHNVAGIAAFRQGGLLPLSESPEIHRLRMAQRIIGTEFEKKYSVYPPGDPRGKSV